MTKILLSLHVLAAIIAIGPVSVAASMFPPAARRAGASESDTSTAATIQLLHRVCRVYAGIGLAVPVLGFATASYMGILGSAWLIASIILTAAAAGILVVLVLPNQEKLLARITTNGTIERSHTAQLAMYASLFNLLWAAVTVLMVVRPGSTTGA
ncbi:hypothetical protein CG747_41935 [Streptomyces sp. CB02959]|uniref:DUF2269 family protein n=1 Tax=Streptomyces sp. CB02959 TaxID=2020330 RepID=UPI000C27B37A|nr:hypothetical protein [Streptomyces sp. CB02959]PJN32498.1 hypothetical protein CG747_41935 [Streptomyces sp. CB02959]